MKRSFCLATWEDAHGEVFAITGVARRGSAEQLLVKEFPKFQCSAPAGRRGIDTGSPWSPRIRGYEK